MLPDCIIAIPTGAEANATAVPARSVGTFCAADCAPALITCFQPFAVASDLSTSSLNSFAASSSPAIREGALL